MPDHWNINDVSFYVKAFKYLNNLNEWIFELNPKDSYLFCFWINQHFWNLLKWVFQWVTHLWQSPWCIVILKRQLSLLKEKRSCFIHTQQLSGSAAAQTQIWFVHQCDLICQRIIDSWILNVDFWIEIVQLYFIGYNKKKKRKKYVLIKISL